MNEQLKKLYEKEFDKKILKSKFTQEEIEKISAPFLLSIEEEKYLQAKTKILYIGKETNKWWGKLKHFIEFDNSIDILRQRYRVEFDGGKVLASNKKGNGDGYTSYKKEDWASNAFFSKFNYIKNNTKDLDSYVIWTELLKCDSGAKGSSRNSNHIEEVVEISKRVLKREIDILKPDFIVFVTATSQNTKEYDDIIKEVLEGYKTEKGSLIKGKYWKFTYDNIICYRTQHPLSYQFSKNKTIDFYEKIVHDIKYNS